MRVTMQCGREGTARHNARDFCLSLAEHIDQGRTHENFFCVSDEQYRDLPPEQAELEVYRERYGDALARTNSRYKASRHPERCKTMEQIWKGKTTRPEEVILQVGSMQDGVDPMLFARCLGEWLHGFRGWCEEHGAPCHLLSIAVHLDESTPHAHVRRVWEYRGQDGLLHIGQEQALRQAGIPLPHPDKPPGRYNNRKMTVDKVLREMWQDIVESHGIQLEREPRPDQRHVPTHRYAMEQMQAERDALRSEVDALRAEREDLEHAMEHEETLDERLAGLRAQGRLEALEERYPDELKEMEDRLRAERQQRRLSRQGKPR